MKVCVKCKIEKELCDFPKSKKYSDGHQSYCKTCSYRLTKNWVKNNRAAVKRINNNHNKKLEVKQKNKARDKSYIADLADFYVKRVLINLGFPPSEITNETVEIKRLLLKTKREIKNHENKD